MYRVRVFPHLRPRRLCFALGIIAFLATPLFLGLASGTDTPFARPAGTAASPGTLAPQIRVMIAADVPGVKLRATAPPVLESAGGAVRLSLPDQAVTLERFPGGWQLGNQTFAHGPITLRPREDGSLRINDQRYRGALRCVPRAGDSKAFDVVNVLDLESYLGGVLQKELPPRWLPETYKAQAVVARTYAIWEVRTAGAERGHFDVYDDTKSQVYGGMDAETAKSLAAVKATRGQVVVHETQAGPRIFKAYFHSTSGGATLGVDAAFNEPPIRALSAQSLGDLSSASQYHRWDAIVISKKELTRRLSLWGKRRGHPVANMARAERLEIADTNDFGRPTRFEVVDLRGSHYSLIPEEIRWALNTDAPENELVRSGFFTPINNRDSIVISDGRGWGHGVGMCQFSAEAMAKEGKNFLEIVTRSYPGTRVVRAY